MLTENQEEKKRGSKRTNAEEGAEVQITIMKGDKIIASHVGGGWDISRKSFLFNSHDNSANMHFLA